MIPCVRHVLETLEALNTGLVKPDVQYAAQVHQSKATVEERPTNPRQWKAAAFATTRMAARRSARL